MSAIDTNRLASSGGVNVKIWNLTTGNFVRLNGHSDIVSSVCAIDANRLASASGDQTVRVWNLTTGQTLLNLSHPQIVGSVCAIDANRLASASQDKKVRIWDLTEEKVINVLQYAVTHSESYSFPRVMVCAIDLDRIAGAFDELTVYVWDLRSTTVYPILKLEGQTGRITSVCAIDGNRLASGSWNETVLWDLTTGKILSRSGPAKDMDSGSAPTVLSVCAIDGNRLASARSDGTVRAWYIGR